MLLSPLVCNSISKLQEKKHSQSRYTVKVMFFVFCGKVTLPFGVLRQYDSLVFRERKDNNLFSSRPSSLLGMPFNKYIQHYNTIKQRVSTHSKVTMFIEMVTELEMFWMW